ncbi:hypothetical protein [Desulfovirgula thermocuniculi]|uniref:hypothetical protein n=1 Tax=Desulfovirgula thermocuniculi TaxID=348842 RepID=UPI0004070D6B|nr:hypothetical protein [Desulfovirgula thermocuniculi]
MVVRLPDLESLIQQAREAGATRVYTTLTIECTANRGLVTYHARFKATAVGVLACHAGGPEKALLRFEEDFGPVLEDIAERKPPESYRQRVDGFVEKARQELAAAGFDVRPGEVESL